MEPNLDFESICKYVGRMYLELSHKLETVGQFCSGLQEENLQLKKKIQERFNEEELPT